MSQEEHRLQQRLQGAVKSTIEEIDKEKLRKLRRECTSRSLGCFDNASLTMEQLDNCLQQYNKPMEVAQNIIQNEMAKLQDRLQRCSSACQDTVQDKYPRLTSTSGKEYEDAMKMALKCNTTCVDTQINLLKSFKGNILKDLDEVMRNMPK